MGHKLRKSEIFELWCKYKKDERLEAIFHHVMSLYGNVDLSDEISSQIKSTLRSLCQQMELKWQKCNRTKAVFLKNNEEWLQGEVCFPNANVDKPSTSGETSHGRPQKRFSDCSDKTKRRKVKELVEGITPEKIAVAAEAKLLQEGKRDSAALVKELFQASPQRGTKIKHCRTEVQPKQTSMPPDDALSMIIDANLSTHQYDIIRKQGNELVKNMYPSYKAVKEAKLSCYPSNILINENRVEIPMQSLIEHTAQRLCLAQKEVLDVVPDLQDIRFLIKWGCDGAQQRRYKQRFSDQESTTDENMFSFSMVPIQLYGQIGQLKKIIWQNPAPSSTRYCRPIKFLFAKETPELIVGECKKIEDEIETLGPVTVEVGDSVFVIQPVLVLSMIDGKVCSALSSYTSSQACFLCGATPKDMNKPNVEKKIDEKTLSFGLSPLHSWIRFMECILHISYRLPLKVWRVMGEENKKIVQDRKKCIQDSFKNEMGILVDMPTQQSGNTNDGNTARRFFRNAGKSSDITGVELSLIKHFHVILEAMNCGFPINAAAFESYTKETLAIYLKNYQWYPMPSSVHKVLCHGATVIRSCIIPIGQLSEEAQESRNKDCRKYRELFTRKCSRVATNTDLIHRLLISSDPYITSKRQNPKRGSKKSLTREVIPLLSVEPLELESDVSNAEQSSSESD